SSCIFFRTGWNWAHGGHSKSPNSSSFTGAVAGPIVFGGSAPGATNDGIVGLGVLPVAACGVPVVEALFKYQAEPSATPSTLRIIKNGRIRFMVVGMCCPTAAATVAASERKISRP